MSTYVAILNHIRVKGLYLATGIEHTIQMR